MSRPPSASSHAPGASPRAAGSPASTDLPASTSPPAVALPAPVSLASVAARVEKRIDTLFDAEIARWSGVDPDLAEPLRSLQRLIEVGGKRLRPTFCYWAFVGAGGDPEDPCVIEAGAAFEMLHAFALTHDDVMDGSATRRGMTTTHIQYQARHEAEGWHGEARRFGEGVAVLAGNLAHIYADRLMDSACEAVTASGGGGTSAPADGAVTAPAGGAAGRASTQAAAVWHELRLELNFGQYLDVLGTARADRDPRVARLINRYKSGKYTIERPLHLGAALAGRLDDLQTPLTAYGDPLGEAFQLRDDVLGVFGDEALTGKPVGQDLREGKPTPLLAAAHQRANATQAAVLDRVGAEDLSDATVASMQEILVSMGALAEIERRIADLKAEALKALTVAPLTPDAKEPLAELAHFVASRTS